MASVSIVIINHNYGQFLKAAIDSALSQTSGVDKIIVVDDGSTDESEKIISEYSGKIVAVMKERGGHVTAVNAGFQLSTGELCIFLDADDILAPNCVPEVLSAWRSSDVKVQYRLNTIDADGVDQNMPFPHYPPNFSPSDIQSQSLTTSWYPWPVSSGNAFSRSYLQKMLPIDTARIPQSPDGYLNKMAPLFGEVRSIPNILGSYRVHHANAWAKAGTKWSPATAIRWLKFDRILEDCFSDFASRRGIAIQSPLQPSNQQLEYRALALRLQPAETPFKEQSRFALLTLCIRSTMRKEGLSLSGKMLWSAWFSMILYAPRILVRQLFARSRGQTGRANIFRRLVALSRRRRLPQAS